jgi:hypothetical protein
MLINVALFQAMNNIEMEPVDVPKEATIVGSKVMLLKRT